MSWTRLDDRWTDSPELRDLSMEARWHYLCMIQFCSRTATYDGIMRARDARRCSDVDDPAGALAALDGAGLIRAEGDRIHLLRLEQHIPSPSVRENAERSKIRMRRHRKHKNGDHSECLPETCSHAHEGRNATAPVTRNTGTGQDRTGQDKAGVTEPFENAEQVSIWPVAVPGGKGVTSGQAQDVSAGTTRSTYCRAGGCSNRPLPGIDLCTEHRPDREAAEAARERELRSQEAGSRYPVRDAS